MTYAYAFRKFALVSAFVAAPTASVLRAQDVLVAPNVTGRVMAIGGIPVAGIEVKLDGTSLSARTDTQGAFAFTNAPSGVQDLLFRGIGYLPTRASIRVPERSLDVKVTMLPAPAILDTVKVRERMNVLSGVVVDEHERPVPGATIEVITGDKQTITTGDDGWFILTSVRDGVIAFRTRKEGYYLTNTAVRMNDWRGVVVHIETLDAKLSDLRRAEASGESNNAAVAWRDAGLRMSMKGSRAIVLSEEELAPFADMSLNEAIKRTRTGATLTFDLQNASGSVCVLLDGRRAVGSTSLDSWRASEVEMVELYPPGTELSGTAGRYLRGAGCRTIATGSLRRGPFYAVLWLK